MKKSIVMLALSLCICNLLITANADSVNEIVEKEIAQEQVEVFSDVMESDWYYDDVKYVRENRLMNGTSESEFTPSGVTTRAMIVTILWRVEGEPIVEGKAFTDVPEEAYYSKAVAWASANQIVSGYDDTTFGPNNIATREQLATIMYRYASYKKYDLSKKTALDKYDDKNEVSGYAVESMEWATANGIVSGTSEVTISPKNNVLRSQVAAILRRFCENFDVLKSDAKNDLNSGKDEEDKPIEGGETSGGSSSSEEGSEESSDSEIPPEPDEEISEETEVKTATIKLKTTYGKMGELVPVVIDIRENPGILGMILSLEYDEEALTLVSVENGEAVEGVLTLTHSKELVSGMNFVWDGLELNSEDIKQGTLLTLYFQISSEAIPGKRYPLMLTHKPGSVIDADLNNVNLIISQGYIEAEE